MLGHRPLTVSISYFKSIAVWVSFEYTDCWLIRSFLTGIPAWQKTTFHLLSPAALNLFSYFTDTFKFMWTYQCQYLTCIDHHNTTVMRTAWHYK